MSEVTVRKVSSEDEYQAFLRLPWTIYKDEPHWTPPLWKEHVEFFDPERNVELRHIDFEKFVAWRGDTPVGTIIAHINHNYNEFQEVNVGWFGQFEVLNDPQAAAALLKMAENWVSDKGVDSIIGPATFSTNSEIGLLVDGYDTPPMILCTHAPRYYRDFIESNGFEKAMDMWCWYMNGNDWGGKEAPRAPEKIARVVEKIRKRRNFTMRNPNMRRFEEELAHLKLIYNQAWAKNWGFLPMTDEEFDQVAAGLKQMADPHITFFVEVDGEPVAFGLPLPDIYRPLRQARCKPGEPHWWQLLRLIWHWKIRPTGRKGVRVWALGALEEYRGTGVDALLYYEMLLAGLKRGYVDIEMSWILETNDMMNRGIQLLGAEVYRTYRVYEKKFG